MAARSSAEWFLLDVVEPIDVAVVTDGVDCDSEQVVDEFSETKRFAACRKSSEALNWLLIFLIKKNITVVVQYVHT